MEIMGFRYLEKERDDGKMKEMKREWDKEMKLFSNVQWQKYMFNRKCK